MYDLASKERIGSALQALAADLVTERRRVLLLRRENRELRAKLAALQGGALEPDAERFGDETEAQITGIVRDAASITGEDTRA